MTTNHSPYKSKGGLGRLTNALRYSSQGLAAAFRHEAAFRQELLLAVVLVPLALWIGRSGGEIALLIGSVVFVLIVELLNSALEALADTITVDHHPLIGRAKDLGSAAVLLALLFSAAVWVWIIVSHIAGSGFPTP
ncbi:MAG TPA: diacylglycerol kinase [Burkholderiaceae bacterium]|nr:diacylglycerol kinase [Burkholderiaceae bacterium]